MARADQGLTLERTKLGTWKSEGACAGKISLTINDATVGTGAVATAEGSFVDVPCYAMP